MDFFAVRSSEEAAPPMTALDDYPDVDSGSCRLLGPTALIVQGLMGVLVILSLVYKRHREKPMRPWRIWLFDVSKQVVGQMFVHGVNVLVSGVISGLTDRNACVFYFLNIGIDTTLGVGIIYGCLRGLTYLLSEKLNLKGFESGVYGDPPSFNFWFRQVATYLTALLVMKLVVIGLFIIIPGIFTAGEWLLSWTRIGNGEAFQVIFVMGIFPITMNILQFWLIDSIVKASSPESPVALADDSAEPFDHSAREPLFNASDDEDDDRTPRGRGDIESQLSPHSQTPFNSGPSSYSTGITTPDAEESKSIKESRQPGAITGTGEHSYPPSLSSSVGSSSGGSPDKHREAKNLSKHKGSKKVSSAAPQVSNDNANSDGANMAAVNQNAHIPHKSDDWAISWDDDGENWEQQTNPVEVKGQEHDRQIEQILNPNRARRLS